MSSSPSPLCLADFARLARLHNAPVLHDVEALVVSAGLNVRYLTGFAGSAGLLCVFPRRDPADDVLIVDGRYDFVLRQRIGTGLIAPVTPHLVASRYDRSLADVVGTCRRVGFESNHVTVATLQQWQAAAPFVEFVPIDGAVESLRQIKDASEIEVFRQGGAMISRVAAQLGDLVRVGDSEKAVAGRLEAAIIAEGFSALSFATIVAAGPNSALPHAVPGDRPIGAGDLVVLDFGGVLGGYCLDLTRMVAVGPVPPAGKSLFDAVLAAQDAALAAVGPGVESWQVDRAARGVLEARGLGEAFLHSTGHGLGLEIHEGPKLGKADSGGGGTLQPGMVVTIEPGAYLESVGGVRVEDDVLVTETGYETLTTAPRSLVII